MNAEQVEMEISRANPRAVTCASLDGNSVAVLKDGRWVTVAAKTLMGTWAVVPFPILANGEEVYPQSLYMKA